MFATRVHHLFPHCRCHLAFRLGDDNSIHSIYIIKIHLNLWPELTEDEMLAEPLKSVFLGSITMDMAGVPVGIGTAGGLLVSGLITGYLCSILLIFSFGNESAPQIAVFLICLLPLIAQPKTDVK